jgi:type IV pilus assembly protein PilX
MNRIEIMQAAAAAPTRQANKPRNRAAHRRQRGISLFVVMVIVLLASLLAVWAARSTLFGEMVVGADADYQRAFEAAQMVLQDAELDIQGLRANGSKCVGTILSLDVCRKIGGTARFPAETQEVGQLLAELKSATGGCKNGLCSKFVDAQDIWNSKNANYANRIANAARYGQYTGAVIGSQANDLLAIGNSGDNKGSILLQTGTGNAGAWYWIEVLPYQEAAEFASLIEGASTPGAAAFNLKPSVIYRITVLVRGFRKGTQVVLQETYVPQTLDY